jgi:osmotically-inducible protein OsmY
MNLMRKAAFTRSARKGAKGLAKRGTGRIARTTGLRRRRTGTTPAAGTVVGAGAAGALGAYFLDPQSGKRRRHVARDRLFAFMRRRKAVAERKARYAAGAAQGVTHKITLEPDRVRPDLNDPALARKVESEIFRPADAPKGDINVNAEDGVVYLRGQAQTPEQISELVEKASKVEGVKRVENLLHLPGTPAQMKQ